MASTVWLLNHQHRPCACSPPIPSYPLLSLPSEVCVSRQNPSTCEVALAGSLGFQSCPFSGRPKPIDKNTFFFFFFFCAFASGDCPQQHCQSCAELRIKVHGFALLSQIRRQGAVPTRAKCRSPAAKPWSWLCCLLLCCATQRCPTASSR
ncbi:hypothetical protein B0T25DRAFT_25811 [Lasiosphaeria hispida]|uniref:Uncharacterized protein n=1 Tax=Lasiosphaeria hispida TaxID=260671 RepID=A0AAJ0MJN7_9PEZI|nr:hypothetical protein B0T25DRAFT_25811 [Lasiosphaeria hispida]